VGDCGSFVDKAVLVKRVEGAPARDLACESLGEDGGVDVYLPDKRGYRRGWWMACGRVESWGLRKNVSNGSDWTKRKYIDDGEEEEHCDATVPAKEGGNGEHREP
jgi:hypothetical protein